MTALIVFLWIANMLVDTGGQLFFKAAASEHTAGAGGLAHWKRMASRPWLWFGICCYVLEFFVWMAFLSQVELSVGVMLGSFNIVVIMLAGRLFFKEKLTRWRVTGISLITLGVAIVGVADEAFLHHRLPHPDVVRYVEPDQLQIRFHAGPAAGAEP